jgi:hypothetical protein
MQKRVRVLRTESSSRRIAIRDRLVAVRNPPLELRHQHHRLCKDFGIEITRALRGCSGPCGCRHNISPLQLISKRHPDSKRHFLMNMRQISLGPLAKATSCMVRNSQFLAP